MARIGFNSTLNISGGRWQVMRAKHFGAVAGATVQGGGLGYWYVRENPGAPGLREGLPKHKFRVQRDAVMDAAMMNLRYP